MSLVIKTTGFEQFLDPAGGSWIKALIMGEHGVGKTPSAACWPKPIIADCERGLMSVANKGVPYAEIKSPADMDALLEHLRIEGMKPPEKRKYQTLVIDTVDSYQRVLIQDRLRTERKESLSGWADWGYLDAKMTQLIDRMLNLPMNVVVNMHVKDDKDEDGETSILVKKARLKGDIKDTIFQDFDLIGQMESSYVAEGGERVLKRQIRWHAEPRFPKLRDRSGKLPRFTEVDFTDEDYFRIFNTITAGVDDLPEESTVETLQTEADTSVPAAEPDAKGGPVANPEVPAKKAAKKAPAKKAAAKKTAAKKAEPEPTPESPTPEPEQTETPAADPVETLADQLGAEVISEEPTPEPEPEPEEKPESEAPQEKKATVCGDQPESMKKFPAYAGCGQVLTKDNAARSQIALLRTKTFICDSCFDSWKANN